ncbi:MAG: glycosyltransferase family 2 protein [Dongiaceae bacterium]
MNSASGDCELTILMPCLDEAETLAACIAKARGFLAASGIAGEVLVADNGSRDGSPAIARAAGARVIAVERRGYGAALAAGIAAARGRWVIMGDADDSYDFADLSGFVERLREGYELVMGNRFAGGIARGAMPPLNRYLGNPVLTGLGRLMFRAPSGDFHCGLRGFARDPVARLGLSAPGMEFASEMVVKAALHGLRIAEVPTRLAPDGRSRRPHLRPWRDGWRHLRFLLLHSPRWLFLYPGFVVLLVGLAGMLLLLPAPLPLGPVMLDVHTLTLAAMLVPLGVQMLSFAWLAKLHGVRHGLLPPDPRFERWQRRLTLERVAGLGAAAVALGLAAVLAALALWGQHDFGALEDGAAMRLVIVAATAIVAGVQLVLAGFMAGLLDGR